MNKPLIPQISIFDGITLSENGCALHTAHQLQEACAKVGFDWPNIAPVFDKADEELEEVKEAIANPSKDSSDVQEELGDLLFVCVNLCRHLDIDPDVALTMANQKFASRFQSIEAMLENEQKEIVDLSLDTLEQYWVKAKQVHTS